MIIRKSNKELEKMRIAGRITAQVCEKVKKNVFPGITTAKINEIAESWIEQFGAKSAFKGYRGYPASVCISINEEVVHGIPGSRRIQSGDIVSIDLGTIYDGFYGDMAVTIMVGVADPEIVRLVETTKEALQAGIDKALPGNRLSDISHAIECTTQKAGFSVVRQFVGHGIGRQLHEDPQIPNFGPPGTGPKLKAGMVFAIEPMVNMGCSEVQVLQDGWTTITDDHKPSAHFEHTIVVKNGTPDVLTRID